MKNEKNTPQTPTPAIYVIPATPTSTPFANEYLGLQGHFFTPQMGTVKRLLFKKSSHKEPSKKRPKIIYLDDLGETEMEII